MRQSARIDKLLQGQVRHILRELPDGEIPNPNEHAIRSLSGTAYAAATCLKFTACDAPAPARAAVVRILTDLTRTHVTGGGKTASGKPWGDHWQSAMWAYQAAFAGWLLWPDLPEGLRAGIVKMAVHEADRFLDLSPPYAEFLDTKAEENSWNSLILVFASEVLPNHPHAQRWRERAIEYTISSVATRADRHSTLRVAGRPVREWVQGANVHEDFTMENHGFVHPDYMTTISQNLTHALVYRLAGVPVPEAIFYNAKPSYEVLKFFTLRDGSLFYPNGTDWNLHHLDHTWNMHVLAERLLQDPEASALASCALDTLEKMQARNPSGRLYMAGEYVSYPKMEQHSAFLVASALIAAKLWDPPAHPARLDAVWDRLRGARLFEDGRLFVSRTRAGISSFAWGLRVMGQTVPFTLDPIMNPLNRSYVGLGAAPPAESDKAGRIGIGSATLDRAIEEDKLAISGAIVTEEAGAMSVTASARRESGRQSFSFTALPNGRSVYMERFDGKGQPMFGGMISLLEDPRWVYGSAKREIRQGAGWLNVDDRLGFVLSGTAPPIERREHLTRTLFLDPAPQPGAMTVIVTIPNATAEDTRAAAASLERPPSPHPMVTAISTGGFLVVTNFDGVGHSNPATSEVRLRARTIAVPVNGLSTRVLRVSESDR